MELIEEDFTGRAFDNIKAIHSLVQVVEKEYARGIGGGQNEESYIVKIMCLFFKYRNRPEQLQATSATPEANQGHDSSHIDSHSRPHTPGPISKESMRQDMQDSQERQPHQLQRQRSSNENHHA